MFEHFILVRHTRPDCRSNLAIFVDIRYFGHFQRKFVKNLVECLKTKLVLKESLFYKLFIFRKTVVTKIRDDATFDTFLRLAVWSSLFVSAKMPFEITFILFRLLKNYGQCLYLLLWQYLKACFLIFCVITVVFTKFENILYFSSKF